MEDYLDVTLNGKYRIDRMIGYGSFGCVYRVKNIKNNKNFAMKLININSSSTTELKLLKELNSPNLIRKEEIFVYEDSYCIIMDYCENGNLDMKISEQRKLDKFFGDILIYGWIFDLISALFYLHSMKIIHRDIKPSNIFLTFENKIKLGDFGIARKVDDTTNLTTRIGTLKYMSPEILSFNKYTYKTDIWSLGCVLYELVTLERFYDFINEKNLDLKDNQTFFLQIKQKNFQDLLSRMLVYDQHERANSEDLISCLNKIVHNQKYKQISFVKFDDNNSIYLVENIEDKKKYFLKTYLIDSLARASFEELKILKRLKNPYLVNLVDTFYDEIMFCVLIEHYEGKDLASKIEDKKKEEKKFEKSLIRKWTSEIILGINYLHNNNQLKCIHRDLKPENIFLTGDNQIKIGSLGLSRSTDEDSTIDYTTFAHYNLNPYMSPEMKESKPYSFKTDIWSIGCILYELITLEVFELVLISNKIDQSIIDMLINGLKTHHLHKLWLKMMLKYYPKERANSQQLYREISLQNFEKIIFNNNSASDDENEQDTIVSNYDTLYNGKFRRISLLGLGSSGCVYLVKNIHDKKLYAMKAVLADLLNDSTSKEFEMLFKLNCEYIISLVEMFNHELITCIITEYCEKGDLGKRICKQKKLNQPFDQINIISWIEDILNGLIYLHSMRIIHRDIKPSNIFITKSDSLKLGDFGLSRSFDGINEENTAYVGTFKYMSPEMKTYKKYSFTTDIWSAGCVLFELVTLKQFYDYFKLDNQEEIDKSIKKLKACNLLKELLLGMLKVDSELRLDSRKSKEKIEITKLFLINDSLNYKNPRLIKSLYNNCNIS